jgi:NADH-quinone oxidoreductase subunit M
VVILVLGFFPKPMLQIINPTVTDTLTQHVGITDPQAHVSSEGGR